MTAQKEPKTQIAVSDGASIPDPWDKRLINAWSISLFGAVGLLTYLCVSRPETYGAIIAVLPEGIAVTFKVTFLSICASLPIGMLVGLGKLSKNPFINLVASTYVEVIRGIPLLVQLFYIYFSLSYYLRVPNLVAAVIAISFCYGAYMGEVFRSGISAINKGQTEAARSLGFNKFQTMRYIILPQAWRTILPPIGNECIAMLKDTSLISVVAIGDMFRIAREHASVTFEYFETYTTIALIYLIITLILSKCVSLMEGRLSYYDRH